MKLSGTRREAILEAMIHVAGTKGYLETSVADVIDEAGASRTTFYKHFEDKRDCFLAACEVVSKQILAAATRGCAPGASWPEGVVGGLAAVVELLDRNPALARTAIIEITVVGAEGRNQREALFARLAERLESGLGARASGDLPKHTAVMAVGAVAGLIFDWLRSRREETVTSLLPELEFALLVPYLGPAASLGLSSWAPL